MIPKTPEELQLNFIEAFERLVRACRSFDEGNYSEGPAIASLIFLFVSDDGSRSLISHFSRKKDVVFVDTAKDKHPGNNAPELLLVWEQAGFGGTEFKPFLEKSSIKYARFNDWWQAPVVAHWEHGDISRRLLVLGLRHKEGGGHVDSSHTDEKLVKLLRGEYNMWDLFTDSSGTTYENTTNPAYATIRQIGWELEQTLRQSLPDLVNRANPDGSPGPRMRPTSRRI